MNLYKKLLTGALLLVAGVASAQAKKVVADKIIGVVGDRIILYSDITNSIADAKRNGQPIPDGAECIILEQALISKVMMLQAEKDSLPVTDEDVEATLDNQVRSFIQQLGSKEELERLAGKTIYQLKDDSRSTIRERKLAEAMQEKIVGAVKITPTEVKAFFDQIPTDSLPYFESELEICQISLFPKASRDLEQYIVQEMIQYKRQVESKLLTFEQLAQRYSEDPGSKDRGGSYQLNRNDKMWDPVFLSTAFRLKEGEISQPVKGKFGYHIIQMVKKSGDDAMVRHILRKPPVTDVEIASATVKLDSIKTLITSGQFRFNEAATRFSEDEAAKFQGPCLLNRSGGVGVTIDMLDKDMVAQLSKMKVEEISAPVSFTDEQQGKQGVRIIYLKSRSEPHIMNMRDDYSKIAQAALEEKKRIALDKWLNTMIPTYYISVDENLAGSCPLVEKFAVKEDVAGN